VCYNDNNTISRGNSLHTRTKGKIPKMLDWVENDADYYIWFDSSFTITSSNFQLNVSASTNDIIFLSITNSNIGSTDGTLGFKHTEEECKKRSERCPTRNPSIARAVADKLRGKKRPHLAGNKNAMFGRVGEKSHMLKHVVLATNLKTGETLKLAGAKAIAEAGFNRAHVYACAKNERKTHLNYSFKFLRSLS
jgi:hypothetical protein